MTEICVECGCSVAYGSGRFVNRVPVCTDFAGKVANGHPFPEGDFMCEECDANEA